MSTTSTRRKSKSVPQAIQSRQEAVAAIARIGVVSRLVAQIVGDADNQVAEIAKKRDADTVELKAELKRLEDGVTVYCEANRRFLTNDDRVKFHEFGTGRVSWRARPPKVAIKGVEVVIAACRSLNLDRFIRVKEEINKEAMLAEPAIARSIQGVTIQSEGEDFLIEVTELGNSDARAA